ncbi:MAG: hypothetical protein IJW16_08465, partial [Clostridia bacterium]|nr:hypothetical protein [Clostridia bacterium]
VRRGASESIVFRLKSTKKSTKVVKKRWRICSGPRGRWFESSHSDHKKKRGYRKISSLLFTIADNRFEPRKCEAFAITRDTVNDRVFAEKRARFGSESSHSDHKKEDTPCGVSSFLLVEMHDLNHANAKHLP